ncbi:MAG: Flp pilus assembly complex ATPase component TadA, partial [Clostridiales bacterium]|nr:Flp pilus assembly complex ATPase component TadA [Clostridiales bacterium]
MLELKNVSYMVDEDSQQKEILNNINLKIGKGFIAVTGPNGGGKSTLAKIIAGMIQPTEGRIILDGEDITDMSITDRANHGISCAFQQPVKFKGLTVKDLITFARGKATTVQEACVYLSEVWLCARDYV